MSAVAAVVGGLCGLAVWCGSARTGRGPASGTPGAVRGPRGRDRPRPTGDLVRLLARVGAGLRAGASPPEAWATVLGRRVDAYGVPTVDAVLDAVRSSVDADPVAARHAAHVIAACRVATELGAPLAPVLDQAVRTVEDEHRAEADTEAALAGPRQTVRLLTWLPAGGVLLGIVMGASPVTVLLDGGVGTLCLVLGLIAALTGRAWIRRLVGRTRAAGTPLPERDRRGVG